MTSTDIVRMTESLRNGVCSTISLEPMGSDRYLVHTGFTLPDGDELHLVLKKKDGRWIITDDAHTLMWLSYEDFNLSETRKTILDVTLSSNNVLFDDGRIYIDCTDKDAGQCLMSMIQAVLQTADLLYLTRNNVRNTYTDDVKQLMSNALGNRCVFDKHIHYGEEDYMVDVFVEAPTPLYVFSIPNNDRCKDALITILTLSLEANMEFTSLTFVDQTASIVKENLVKLTNRTDKLFYNTPADELQRFLGRAGLLSSNA